MAKRMISVSAFLLLVALRQLSADHQHRGSSSLSIAHEDPLPPARSPLSWAEDVSSSNASRTELETAAEEGRVTTIEDNIPVTSFGSPPPPADGHQATGSGGGGAADHQIRTKRAATAEAEVFQQPPSPTTLSARQYSDMCIKSENHKDKPGPEPNLHGQVRLNDNLLQIKEPGTNSHDF